MKEFFLLLAPVFWSIKNDIVRFKWAFYKKILFYFVSGGVFIYLIAKLLNIGMAKLHGLSADVFNVLLIKAYSLIFLVIFFMQIVNGFIISFNTYYQSKELEVLFTSPVNRTSLFFSRLLETHMKASWMLSIFGLPMLISLGILYQANLFFYFYSSILIIAFSIIPVNIGIGAAIFISSLFHFSKLKKVLLSSGIISIVAIVILLRFFKPERFVNPQLFANLTLFIAEIKTPSFILLPNRWLSESIFNHLGGTFNSNTLIFLSLLFLTSYITVVALEFIFKKYHYRGWGLLHGGGIILGGKRATHYFSILCRKIFYVKIFRRLLSALNNQTKVLFKKDFLFQVRDAKNIHQILILASLVAVYLFSIISLPLNWVEYAVQLKYFISFLNLGLILVIIASLSSRIVYPAIVSDRAFLWIMKTSPLIPKRYIWVKFFFFFVPIFLLGQLLAISSSLIIGIEKDFIILKAATTALLSFSLIGLAIFFGTLHMKYERSDDYQTESKTESIGYLLVSIFLILFTLALETAPVFLYFFKESGQVMFTQKAWIVISMIGLLLLTINLFITFFSLRVSGKRIDKLYL